jgi:hypothetical protein
MPVNYLVVESLERYHRFYGDDFEVEYPTGSGKRLTLDRIVADLQDRLISLFTRDASGRRACFGGTEKMQADPAWKDNLIFSEYFHGDNGAALPSPRSCGVSASFWHVPAPSCCGVGLLQGVARGQVGTVDRADVVQPREAALEHALVAGVLAVDPPGEVDQQLVEHPGQEVQVAAAVDGEHLQRRPGVMANDERPDQPVTPS